jgi:prolyl-tRNA editing enzyme YbaK/EbsC (Cys-tRNA(Pro) deacylase)
MPIDPAPLEASLPMRRDVVGLALSREGESHTVMRSTAIEQQVRQVLDGLKVPYEVIPIDADYADTAAFCERYGFPTDHSVNTIIVGSKREPKQYCACLVLATTRLDVNHTVRKLMGVSRASFASADDTIALTGMMIGGVTVFALPPDLPIYVDAPIMALDYVILGGGSRSLKLKVSPEVLRRLPYVSVIPGLGVGL